MSVANRYATQSAAAAIETQDGAGIDGREPSKRGSVKEATMSEAFELASAPRWSGTPGRLEVWYTTLTNPATGCTTKPV